MKFNPVKPKKISTQIAEQLKTAILSGEFIPGEKLPPERELSEMFGASRPSVREAIHILSSSGMLKSYQGGGTVVLSLVDSPARTPLSELMEEEEGRALDLVEVRKGLESWTSYYAAKRATVEEKEKLEEIVNKMARNLAILKPSEDLDANFHVMIAKATHNIVWLHFMQTIYDSMKVFQQSVWRAVYSEVEDHRTLLAHHRAISEAIRDARSDDARRAMLDHLSFAESKSRDYIKSREKQILS